MLEPIKVINPYAEFLKIPKEVFKPRRTNAHYIAFIEAITFYKQHQREHKTDNYTGEVYIETTLEDIAEANRLMKYILLRKSDELSGACRAYFEKLKQYLKANDQQSFNNKEIRTVFRISMSRQKKYMLELQQFDYVRKAEGDKKKGFSYAVASYQEYEQLQAHINTVLDQILVDIRGKLNTSSVIEEVQKSESSSRAKRTTLSPVKTEKMSKNKEVLEKIK